jgi:hypothetical protein
LKRGTLEVGVGVLKKRVLLAAMLVSLFLGLAAGCGGDEGLNKEEYVAELNAMCEDFSEKEREIGDPQTPADLVENGPRILDEFERAIADKVHTLEAPDEIAPQADRLEDLADQQRDVLAGLINAAKAGDFGKLRELAAKNAALNRQAESITRELGAEACSEG